MELVDQLNPAELTWNVSRRCNGGHCVQVAHDGKMIFLGDAKDPSGPVLACARPEWQAFVTQIKRGDLDFA